jgi:hypothetical protein
LRDPARRDVCDVPGADITLTGRNYESQDVTGSLRGTVRTGAFVPFGTETTAGQVIEGRVKCTGGVLRCHPDGSELELVAWGFRCPFGLHHHPDGRLFATDHGIDERGTRFVVGDPDDFYEIVDGAWYGWPDYADGKRLDDPSWGDGGRDREPVIAEPPGTPPAPYATFAPHAAANGFDFSPGGDFGFTGDAFVACFGDAAPITTRRITPAGFKVMRIDMASRRVVDFAVNRIAGGASVLPHNGFERPVDCRFGPDGHLYVVDWGEMVPARSVAGSRSERGPAWCGGSGAPGRRRARSPPNRWSCPSTCCGRCCRRWGRSAAWEPPPTSGSCSAADGEHSRSTVTVARAVGRHGGRRSQIGRWCGRAPVASPPVTGCPTPLVEARALTKRFGGHVAVDGIDFHVERGEAFGFLGPNGAGKSSTMRMIGCVSPSPVATCACSAWTPPTTAPASGPGSAWCPRTTRSTPS